MSRAVRSIENEEENKFIPKYLQQCFKIKY